MTRAVLGIIGGSGIYDLPGLEDVRDETIESPWGEPSAAADARRHRRAADRVPAAARQGTRAVALRHQLPRQYRRAEAGRGYRSGFALGLRFVQGGFAARHLRARRSVRRPHPQAREFVLRQGLRGPRLDGPSGIAAAARASGGGRQGRGHRGGAGRHLCLHGRPAILQPRREPDLQGAGLFGDRHDQHARGKTRPRGRDLLRQRGDGHRFRLLASRS